MAGLPAQRRQQLAVAVEPQAEGPHSRGAAPAAGAVALRQQPRQLLRLRRKAAKAKKKRAKLATKRPKARLRRKGRKKKMTRRLRSRARACWRPCRKP